MTHPVSSHSPELFSKLSHDIQSRIMRIRSLTFIIQKLQSNNQSEEDTEIQIQERTKRLDLTLQELTTLTKLQSLLLAHSIRDTLSRDEIREMKDMAQEWTSFEGTTRETAVHIRAILDL